MEDQLVHVREIVTQHGSRQSELIAILQEIQNEYKYLSEGALVTVAEMLHVSPAHVYSVATFYENFSLEAMSASPSPSMTPSMSTWAFTASTRRRTTACSPWRRWHVSAPAAWLPS